MPRIHYRTPIGRVVFGSVVIDGGPLGHLIFRREEHRMYPVTYIGTWAMTQDKNLYYPKLEHALQPPVWHISSATVEIYLPPFGTDQQHCTYILEQMTMTYYSNPPDQCAFGDTKDLVETISLLLSDS